MLSDFYAGFFASRIEIIVLVALLIAFVAMLVVFYLRRERRERRRLRQQGEEAYREQIQSLPLSRQDEDALEKLARNLDRPERKYLLLRNQAMFNACAHRAGETGDVANAELSALRVKLGFTGEKTGETPESTAELPPGAAVLIIEEGTEPVPGQVLDPIPSAFRLRVKNEKPPFTSGDLVEVIYQNRSGIYRFETGILEISGRELSLSHSEEISRVQRRKYYRREVGFPVYIRSARRTDRPIRSQFIDIGGGGASLYNPQGSFKPGDEIELTFHPDSSDTLHVIGDVIRRSHGGEVIHVSFSHLRESARDKIFGILFQRQPSRKA